MSTCCQICGTPWHRHGTACQTSFVAAAPTDACFCVGPQNGEPLCPCAMRSVKIINDRYVLPERDLGPVKEKP